jgi:hypothetical protein
MVQKKTKRSYPPFYEKIVPVVISVLAIVILGILVFTIAVGLGALNFG